MRLADFRIANFIRIAIVTGATLLLPACGTSGISDSGVAYDQALLERALSGASVLGHTVSDTELPNDDVLAMDDEMRAFVHRYVDTGQSPANRLRMLLNAVDSRGVLGVRFEDTATATAHQAYYTSVANCVAYSNLIVALAREAGLTATYQDALVVPQWELTGDIASLQRHINVKIKLPRTEDHVVDFSPYRENTVPLEAKRLSDTQAAAQYFNNIAIAHLHNKNYRQAFLYSRKALALDRRSSYLWSNLGVILGRANAQEEAEAVLQHAITVKPVSSSALTNLVALYTRRGELNRAAQYRREIERRRSQNPYYLLLKAREAFAKDQFTDTLGILRRAQAMKPTEPLLYELQSRALLKLDKRQQGITALENAILHSKLKAQRETYRNRLKALE